MMGDTRHEPQGDKGKLPRKPPQGSTQDPEFEMPDPEQVERDIEQAERLYREEPNKKPA